MLTCHCCTAQRYSSYSDALTSTGQHKTRQTSHIIHSILPICINTHVQYTTPTCPNVHTKYRKYFRRCFNSRLMSFPRNPRKLMHREYYHVYSMSSAENQKGINATVKPRPEPHMDMIRFEVFWRASTWFHNRYYNSTIYFIDNVIVLSDLVESSGYSSKTLQKGSCPYAPLDETLR